jgi:hypothetical protein
VNRSIMLSEKQSHPGMSQSHAGTSQKSRFRHFLRRDRFRFQALMNT